MDANCEDCSTQLVDTDTHALCDLCRPCTEDYPCPLCNGWSSAQWKRFRSRQARALKLKRRLSREKRISSKSGASTSVVSTTLPVSLTGSSAAGSVTGVPLITSPAVRSGAAPNATAPLIDTGSGGSGTTQSPSINTIETSVSSVPSGDGVPISAIGASSAGKSKSSKVPVTMVTVATTPSVVTVTSVMDISSPSGVRNVNSPITMVTKVTQEQDIVLDNFPASYASNAGVTSLSGRSQNSQNSEIFSARPGDVPTYPGWGYPPPGYPNFPRGIGNSGGGFMQSRSDFMGPPPPPGNPAWQYPPWMAMPGYMPVPAGYSLPPGWESCRPGGPSTTVVRPPTEDSVSESPAPSSSEQIPMDTSIRSIASEFDPARSRSSSVLDHSLGEEEEVWTPHGGSLASYREAIDSVKAFLSSIMTAQGEEFNLSPPVHTDVSGAWGRLLPLAQEVEEPTPALPWTPFLRAALRRSNLSVRGIARSQWHEYSGRPLPNPTQAGAGSGKMSSFKPPVASSQAYRSFALTRGEEQLDYPIQSPPQPSRVEELSSSDPRMSVTWAQVTEWEGAIRRSLSMLSHASWWVGAIVHSSREHVSPHSEREEAWAQAGLEAVSASVDLLQRVSTSMLLTRRDAVLQTMELPFQRRLTLRTAPVESRDLFGPDFDRLMTQWSQRDQEDRVVAAPLRTPAPQRPRVANPSSNRAPANTQTSWPKKRRQKKTKTSPSSSSAPPRYPPNPGAGRGRGSGKRGGK